jgi:hypothetical protein
MERDKTAGSTEVIDAKTKELLWPARRGTEAFGGEH